MESSKWQFDEQFLIKTVKDAKRLLKTDLKEQDRIAIEETMEHFLNYLNVKTEPEIRTLKNVNNLTMTKNKFMREAINNYNILGQDMIDIIIYLANNISCFSLNHPHKYKKYRTNMSPEEIVDKTLELYGIYFEKFYGTAKSIIEYPLNLINFTKSGYLDSQCFESDMFKLPFINIKNYNSNPELFAHELQHGIEYMDNYKTELYNKEIGPILMETLFIDTLVKNKERNAATLYYNRIYEIESIFTELLSYYSCVKEFRKYNFEVSNSKFINTLYYHNLIYAKNNIILNNLDIDIEDDLKYLLSFFKALEIRNKVYQDKKYAFILLKKYLNYKNHTYYCEKQMLNDYEEYHEEVISKVKKYPHTKKYFNSNGRFYE